MAVSYLFSGLRANELRSLAADDLDLDRCGVNLDAEWSCDYAAMDPPAGRRGCSLRPVVEEAASAMGRQHLVIEIDRADRHLPGMQLAKHGGKNLIGRAVYEDGGHKYVVYDWGRYREQLFDLNTDPGEMVNLATSSHFAPLLASMRSYLRQWCQETDDHFRVMIPPGDGPAPY